MSLLKPTTQTPFHIDFGWWKQNERDWQVFLRSFLCPEHQQAFANAEDDEMIDWIDPQTAEVKRVDGVQHALISHCAQLPDFINQRTTIVEGIFRLFLANGNIPMSAEELSKKLGKPADTILRTIAGARVYRGLRPILSPPAEG
ncbi:MAG: hypothetical protein LC099_05735 [Anaerolineales bacterium]|nr:hypothetical protein [Anaerolineales bacterium]